MAAVPLQILVCLVAIAAAGCSSSGNEPSVAAPVRTASTPEQPHRKHHRHHRARRPAHVPAVDLPNRRLTPGIALRVGGAQICRAGYASSVRNVPGSEKEAVYRRYRVAHVPYAHEVDHLVSLELGGSNDIRNLWPEPYVGRWGARTKDVLENRLHDLVCSGRLRLRFAQRIEARNWVAAYRRYAVAVAVPQASSAGGFYASSYPTAHTIYCADDPSWKNLSRRYLRHFATLARARRRFPGYRLHRAC